MTRNRLKGTRSRRYRISIESTEEEVLSCLHRSVSEHPLRSAIRCKLLVAVRVLPTNEVLIPEKKYEKKENKAETNFSLTRNQLERLIRHKLLILPKCCNCGILRARDITANIRLLGIERIRYINRRRTGNRELILENSINKK